MGAQADLAEQQGGEQDPCREHEHRTRMHLVVPSCFLLGFFLLFQWIWVTIFIFASLLIDLFVCLFVLFFTFFCLFICSLFFFLKSSEKMGK